MYECTLSHQLNLNNLVNRDCGFHVLIISCFMVFLGTEI